MTSKSRMVIEDAKRWMGQPVCIVLKDGSFYVGVITEVENRELTLSGKKGRGKVNSSFVQSAEKAKLNGFFPQAPAAPASLFGGGWEDGLFGFRPGGAGGVPAGPKTPVKAGGGILGMLGIAGKFWPILKIGFGMLRTIVPLLGGLKI